MFHPIARSREDTNVLAHARGGPCRRPHSPGAHHGAQASGVRANVLACGQHVRDTVPPISVGATTMRMYAPAQHAPAHAPEHTAEYVWRGNQDHSSNVLLGKRLKFTFHTKMFASLLYLNNTVRYKIPIPGRYGPWTRVYGPFLGLWSTPCFNCVMSFMFSVFERILSIFTTGLPSS